LIVEWNRGDVEISEVEEERREYLSKGSDFIVVKGAYSFMRTKGSTRGK
jgi:hypothetical protein